jgi:AcrR family transcriptional regulator
MVVDVVARLDDQAIAHSHDEHARNAISDPGADHDALIGELAHDHLRVSGLVNANVNWRARDLPGIRRRGEMGAELIARAQPWRPLRVKRVHDVAGIRVKLGQRPSRPAAHRVDERHERLGRRSGLRFRGFRSHDSVSYYGVTTPRNQGAAVILSPVPETRAADEHPRRRAGRANRSRVLDAADHVFASQGEAGSTEEVAALAGVGVGTVFRHFPTKAELLDAVLTRRFDRLTERASALLADDEDPLGALHEFMIFMVDEAPGKIAIGAALLGAGGDLATSQRAAERTRRATGRLVRRAQDAGVVRADVKPAEVYAVMAGTARAVTQAGIRGAARERAVAVVIDGLRALHG